MRYLRKSHSSDSVRGVRGAVSSLLRGLLGVPVRLRQLPCGAQQFFPSSPNISPPGASPAKTIRPSARRKGMKKGGGEKYIYIQQAGSRYLIFFFFLKCSAVTRRAGNKND